VLPQFQFSLISGVLFPITGHNRLKCVVIWDKTSSRPRSAYAQSPSWLLGVFWSLGVLVYEIIFGMRPFDNHCGISKIHFVENRYWIIWDRIQESNIKCLLIASIGKILRSMMRNLGKKPFLSAGRFPMCCKSGFQIWIVRERRFSRHAEISLAACCMFAFQRGLLYVRIPKRLGVGDNFRPLCDHDWFTDQNIDIYGGTVFLVQL
jgi:hypothetical protein